METPTLDPQLQGLMTQGCTRQMVAMQGLGYKEIIDYLEGKITLDEAIYIIKRDTRHFAKRQITWFKREKDVVWVQKDQLGQDENQILDFMINTRLSDLQAENQNLKLKASQEEQNNYLVSQLKPCPIPAYITCNPYESAYGFRGYSNCGGCGC